MAAEIEKLIERLEKATGPDRELDRDIQAWVCEHVLGWQWVEVGADAKGENSCTVLAPPNLSKDFSYPPLGKINKHFHVPSSPITKSIDAALTLVPEGFAWMLRTQGISKMKYFASVTFPDEYADAFTSLADGAAIALCIACLKALAALSALSHKGSSND